jgi:hypothetical protein
MRTPTILLMSLLCLAARDARGQTTIGVAAGASRQEAGASDLPNLGPPFGGTSAAVLGMIDFHLAGHLTLGGEGSLATAITGNQSQRTSTNTNAFTSRHSDNIFSGVLKVGTSVDRRLHGAATVGGGAAWRRTKREGTTASLFPPSTRLPFSDTASDFVFAYSLGGDVDLRVTPRIRLLGLVRWYRLLDDDRADNGVVKRGVASKILRGGAGVKIGF